MSQYPVRSGPIQNDPAPFSPEMAYGYQPTSPLPFVYRQTRGWTALGGVEPFFSPEMAQGVTSPTSRAFPPKNVGWSETQVTPVPAPFSVEMSTGYEPATSRSFIERPTGWFTREPDVLFASNEEFQGSHPDTSRQVKSQLGPSFFPYAATPASFSPEMIAGFGPVQSRAPLLHNLGWYATQLVDPFDITMVLGHHPDVPLRWKGRIIDWTIGDVPSNVSAPFTSSMSAGSQPDRNRAYRSLIQGVQIAGDVDPFRIESILASRPDRPRLFRAPLGVTDPQLTFVAVPVTSEMFYGQAPSAPRLFKAREPSQVSAPTPIMVFTPEMVQGWHPDLPQFFKGPRTLGWQTAQTTPGAAPFSVEMFLGSRTDRPNLMALRQPLFLHVLSAGFPFGIPATSIGQTWNAEVLAAASYNGEPILGITWNGELIVLKTWNP